MIGDDRTLVRNAFLTGLAELSGGLLYLLLILAARAMGTAAFGRFHWAFTLTMMLEIATDLGLRLYCVREVAREPARARELLAQAMGLKLFLCLLYLAATSATAFVWRGPGEVFWTVLLLGFSLVLRSYKFLARAFFQARGRFDLEALTCLGDRLVLLLAGLAVLAAGGGPVALAAVFAGVHAADVAVTLFVLGRFVVPPGFAFSRERWRELWRGTAAFALTLGFLQVYFRINEVLLYRFWPAPTGDTLAGLFGGGHSFIEALAALPRLLVNVLFPAMSLLHWQSRETLVRLYGRANRWLLTIILGLVALLLVEPAALLRLLGAGFAGGAAAFRLLLLSTIFLFLSYLGGVVAGAIDRQYVNALAGAAAVAAGLATGLVLVPRCGIVGAACGSLAGEATFFAVIYGYVAWRGYAPGFWLNFWRPGLAALAAAGALRAGRAAGAPEIPALAGGAVVFLLVLWLAGGLRRDYLLPRLQDAAGAGH